jgi:choice-of-anchor C domain-containing protein
MIYDNKWRNGFVTILGVVLIILTVPLSVQASIIVNGSFETGINLPPINGFRGVSATSTRQIEGWIVTSGAIEWVGNQYWEASDGNYSIDLSAGSPGAISQGFNTVVGMDYNLSFDLAGNPEGGPRAKTMDIAVADVNQRFTFDTGGYSKSNMGWQTITLGFTANAVTTDLNFIGVSPGAYGAAIDNVDVSVVPLPPAIVLLSTGLVALVGIRRKLMK